MTNKTLGLAAFAVAGLWLFVGLLDGQPQTWLTAGSFVIAGLLLVAGYGPAPEPKPVRVRSRRER